MLSLPDCAAVIRGVLPEMMNQLEISFLSLNLLHTLEAWLIWPDVLPLQKTFHGLQIAPYCCFMHWGIFIIVFDVDVYHVFLDQPPDDVNAASFHNGSE